MKNLAISTKAGLVGKSLKTRGLSPPADPVLVQPSPGYHKLKHPSAGRLRPESRRPPGVPDLARAIAAGLGIPAPPTSRLPRWPTNGRHYALREQSRPQRQSRGLGWTWMYRQRRRLRRTRGRRRALRRQSGSRVENHHRLKRDVVAAAALPAKIKTPPALTVKFPPLGMLLGIGDERACRDHRVAGVGVRTRKRQGPGPALDQAARAGDRPADDCASSCPPY